MRELGILAVFILTISMAVILPARADPVPTPGTTIETQFVPSGPGSDRIVYNIFADETAEFNALQTGQIDLTDTPITPNVCPLFGCCNFGGSGSICSTADVTEFGFQHNDINLANSFWGVTMCFGQDEIIAGMPCTPKHGAVTVPSYPFTTATCPNVPAPHTGDCSYAGIQWRQGFAQLLSKQALVTSAFAGAALPLDNLGTTPAQGVQHSGLPVDSACAPVPNTTCVGSYSTGAPANYNLKGVCSWDSLHTTSSTGLNNCLSAFKYSGTLTSSDGFTYEAGTTNFCDAADHFIAAGIAVGKDANCRLTSLQGPGGNVVFRVRSDSANRFRMGNAIFNRFCDLLNAPVTSILGGSQCSRITSTGATLTLTDSHLTIIDAFATVFAGCSTDGINTNCPNLSWHLYTGANSGGPAFNQQWALYNSNFDSTICGGTSSTPAGAFIANYVYSCNDKLDHYNSIVENNATVTGAAQALQVAMEIFGNHTISVPTVSRIDTFAWSKGWIGVSVASGIGIASGNFWSLLNMWNPNPTISGPAIRWGMKQGTSTLNPFESGTVFEGNVLQEIYDPLLAVTPYIPLSGPQIIGYLANQYSLVSHTGRVGTLDINCPASVGVFSVGGCVKINLRGDIFFQDGVQLTASDVKFSFENFNATGGLTQPFTANTVDVVYDPRVLPTSLGGTEVTGQPENLYIALASANAFSLLDIAGVPIVPQHVWKTIGASGPCKDTSLAAAGSGKASPQCTVDPSFLLGPGSCLSCIPPSDPVANNMLIGSGPYACVNPTTGQLGGGCTSTGTSSVSFGTITLSRFGGSNPVGLSTSGAYFRSNAKFEQFQWAAAASHNPLTVDLFALSAVVQCATSPTGTFCAHYNSPDAILSCTNAGPCIGVLGGGDGSGDFRSFASQVDAWFLTFWTSPIAYGSLDGVQPRPQTLGDDGSQYS